MHTKIWCEIEVKLKTIVKKEKRKIQKARKSLDVNKRAGASRNIWQHCHNVDKSGRMDSKLQRFAFSFCIRVLRAQFWSLLSLGEF